MEFVDLLQHGNTENGFGQLMEREDGFGNLFTENGFGRLITENGIGRLARLLVLYTGNGGSLFSNTLIVIVELILLLVLGLVFGIMPDFVNGATNVFGWKQNVTVGDLVWIFPQAETYIKELGIEDFIDYLGIFPKLE